MDSLLTGHTHIGWRVSNKVFIALSLLVVALTWTMIIVAYPALPDRIPSHFGPDGLVDATMVKTWLAVSWPGIIQTLLVGLMWWLSNHPQYSNMTTMVAMKFIPEPTQSTVKRLLSHMVVMTGLIISLIFAYISLGMVRVGLGLASHLNVWAILGLVAFLILILVVYTVWLAKLTRHVPAQPKP